VMNSLAPCVFVRVSGFFSSVFSVCRCPFIVNRFLLGFVERCREICTLDWIGVKTRVSSWLGEELALRQAVLDWDLTYCVLDIIGQFLDLWTINE